MIPTIEEVKCYLFIKSSFPVLAIREEDVQIRNDTLIIECLVDWEEGSLEWVKISVWWEQDTDDSWFLMSES